MRCWGCTSPWSLLSWFIYVKGLLGENIFWRNLNSAQRPEGLIFSPFLVLISRTRTKAQFDIETSKYEDQGQWLGMQWIGLVYYSSTFMWSNRIATMDLNATVQLRRPEGQTWPFSTCIHVQDFHLHSGK